MCLLLLLEMVLQILRILMVLALSHRPALLISGRLLVVLPTLTRPGSSQNAAVITSMSPSTSGSSSLAPQPADQSLQQLVASDVRVQAGCAEGVEQFQCTWIVSAVCWAGVPVGGAGQASSAACVLAAVAACSQVTGRPQGGITPCSGACMPALTAAAAHLEVLHQHPAGHLTSLPCQLLDCDGSECVVAAGPCREMPCSVFTAACGGLQGCLHQSPLQAAQGAAATAANLGARTSWCAFKECLQEQCEACTVSQSHPRLWRRAAGSRRCLRTCSIASSSCTSTWSCCSSTWCCGSRACQQLWRPGKGS